MPEGNTRLVRMSVELFEQLMNTATSNVTVEWGEPVEWLYPVVWDSGYPTVIKDAEPVYSPIIRRHFQDDLDDEPGIYDSDFGEAWVP